MKYEQTRETHKIWGGNLNYSFLGRIKYQNQTHIQLILFIDWLTQRNQLQLHNIITIYLGI